MTKGCYVNWEYDVTTDRSGDYKANRIQFIYIMYNLYTGKYNFYIYLHYTRIKDTQV